MGFKNINNLVSFDIYNENNICLIILAFTYVFNKLFNKLYICVKFFSLLLDFDESWNNLYMMKVKNFKFN